MPGEQDQAHRRQCRGLHRVESQCQCTVGKGAPVEKTLDLDTR